VPGWKDTQIVEQTNRQTITVFAPAPWLPKAEREPPRIIDAEFEAVALPAPKSVDELRAERRAILLREAEKHLADPARIVRPDPNHPAAYTGGGRPTFNEPQEHAGEHNANGTAPAPDAPYIAPKPSEMAQAPRGPTPSYVRRSAGPTQGVRADGTREPVRSVIK
jgi:hypothetical protein